MITIQRTCILHGVELPRSFWCSVFLLVWQDPQWAAPKRVVCTKISRDMKAVTFFEEWGVSLFRCSHLLLSLLSSAQNHHWPMDLPVTGTSSMGTMDHTNIGTEALWNPHQSARSFGRHRCFSGHSFGGSGYYYGVDDLFLRHPDFIQAGGAVSWWFLSDFFPPKPFLLVNGLLGSYWHSQCINSQGFENRLSITMARFARGCYHGLSMFHHSPST